MGEEQKEMSKLPACRHDMSAAKSLQLCPTLCDPRDGSPKMLSSFQLSLATSDSAVSC